MFLVFALLLLALGVGLFLNVYASFFPFLQSIGHISDYNVAYYSAISAVERGMLTTKYRVPGFQGSGGELANVSWGPLSDQDIFFVTGGSQGNWRVVNSRTTSIPNSDKGNVDPFLITVDSMNYNALRYGVSERFLFSIDNESDPEKYYSGVSNIAYFAGGTFSGELRLPPFVMANFANGGNANLCDQCDTDGDGIYDEIKLTWGMQGRYFLQPFAIVPTINIFYYSGMWVNYDFDNTLRASLIQPIAHLEPNNYTFVANGGSLTGHTIVSPDAATLQFEPFQNILGGGNFTDLQLSLGLVAFLRSVQGAIYPYLEYRLEFPEPVADRFFTIDGHGRNRDYDVQIQIKKPTVRGTVGGDFTVIF